MNIIYFLMPLALGLGAFFVAYFILTALRGEYEDLETPAHRILIDEDLVKERYLLSTKFQPKKGHKQ